eukprot:GILI01013241.1.p1 GENE.GILI01013241.1~~GILI01013241.1.p1  ORF type:complete len:662 (+),score=117.21 GILI01013241.1:165-1988(+)
MKDNVNNIKERLGMKALVIHSAHILDDADTVRNWYTPIFPIIAVECVRSFEETDDWAKNPNLLARLLNAQVPMQCAIVCLSRANWREGYPQFLDAASFLRQQVDSTGMYDYMRRTELICLSMSRKELMPVAPFVEKSRDLLSPPCLRGDNTGGQYVGEWVDVPRTLISSEEAAMLREKSLNLRQIQDKLKDATKAMVRVFGYHPLSPDVTRLTEDTRQRVVAASGFFISPIHILTTRTVKFYAPANTYAQRFTFYRGIRGVHGMLRKDVELLECREVPRQMKVVSEVIRSIGVEMPDNKFPAGAQSVPWCDLMLLEVVNARDAVHDHDYLLPDLNCGNLKKGDEVMALHFPTRPSEEYFSDVFGPRGYNTTKATGADVGTQFWDYNQLCCSFGNVQVDADDSRQIRHTCSVLPGSRGAPIIGTPPYVSFEKDGKSRNVDDSFACTYAGIQVGRAVETFEAERTNIITMSTSDVARQEGLFVNMYNEAVTANHVVLILLYIKFVSAAITNQDHQRHLQKFLGPFEVLVSPEVLSQCHRSMLKDADDCNEFGMDFYEHQDLTSALECFREGAKMFTTASIPNLTQAELDLKSALQTNVSAVVVAKMNQK